MGNAAEVLHLSYLDYLALERSTEMRHEYLDGEAWMMAGGSPRHAKVIMNLSAALVNRLADGPCQAYSADLKIRVLATGLATYPDASVICGPLERHPEDRNAITNPTLIVEVLSPSTEGWDRGPKFRHFQQIPGLQHYLLVDQDEVRVEHYVRTERGWHYSVHGPGEQLVIDATHTTLDVDALYRNLPEA